MSLMHPRRGGAPVDVPSPDPQAREVVERLLATAPGFVERALGGSFPDGPSHAAAVAFAAKYLDWRVVISQPWFAELWMIERGVVFAATAAAELFTLMAAGTGDGPYQGVVRPGADPEFALDPVFVVRHRRPGEERAFSIHMDPEQLILFRMRAVLAAAPDDVYAEAVAALRDLRPSGPWHRCATAVLAPSEKDWVAADWTEALTDKDHRRASLLLGSISTPEQVAEARALGRSLVTGWRGLHTTLIDGVGPSAAAGLLLSWLDHMPSTDSRGRTALLSLVASLPGDEPFKDLISSYGDRHVRSALIQASRSDPERAARLLAAADSTIQSRPGFAAVLRRVSGPASVADALPALLADPPWKRPKADRGPDLPERLPVLPDWIDPALLPLVRLRASSLVLPDSAARDLAMVFALGRDFPGATTVREALDDDDLTEFAWALFERWDDAGAEGRQRWVLDTLGWLGDDETARRLTPRLLEWPGESRHARAVAGLDILAEIGTEGALQQLNRVAERSKFKGLRSAAQQKVAAVAAGLGLTGDQLADRLAPDFGLPVTLDYGPRQFTAVADELGLSVTDASGKRLKSLPRPGARDDATLAPAAYKQFTALKKDFRTATTDQVRRLERAMANGREWTPGEFRRFFLDHPVLTRLARRLVWSGSAAAFRIAEDGTLAGVDDEPATLAETDRITVAHPLHLGDDVARWSELFADYQIVQPFDQLGREVLVLTAEEAGGAVLTRFAGETVPTGAVVGLENRGWRRDAAQDGGVQPGVLFPLGDDGAAYLDLTPGIVVGALDILPEQKLGDLTLQGPPTRFADLNARTVSELLRDLTLLTAAR
ncbi:hypothetical protein ACTI_01660 [Actinoplanes sp. OR16]|uniref:DUF4132 domain-containing protein n=1 Tax=Actinoplanes sp. OR16 TaxID=946334 RepID=UPI000F710A51|nr:DUF4132 domain-containing protein [Actinoplanes sp. OR16]BBH63481.1 hypothetical protein ACTI_01660 [Actinoplanes sp. OR16]